MLFKYINYAFRTKKAIDQTDEFLSDASFAPLEGVFIISFMILGIITLGLGFLAFFYLSKLALFFAIIFLLILSIDIFIFIKVKKALNKLSRKFVDFSKNTYQKIKSKSENIVDVDYE